MSGLYMSGQNEKISIFLLCAMQSPVALDIPLYRSSIQYPVSGIQHPVSSIKYPET
jgi:hypothetical protein